MQINRDLQATSHIIRWLERSSETSDHLLDEIPGVFAILAADGQILRSNRNFSAQAGVQFETTTEMSFFDLVEFGGGTSLADFFQKLFAESNLKLEGTFKFVRQEPRRFQFDFSTFRSSLANSSDLIIVHGQDVTDIQRMAYENARMNSELDFAKKIQSSLFPPDYFELENFQIAGYLMPATECAGDWWHYSQHENKLIVWIGDVVGHGAASALLTSAVNSAISILETGERSSISATLARLNTMIFQTTRGSQCMTMQGFEIDLISGLCRVASASHPEPFKVYRSRDHDTKKLVSLMETLPSAMLGASMGSSYTEIEFQISPGERIFLYTDGVSELRNERGDMYGGRRLIKSLDKIGALPGLGAKAFREAFLEEVASFKGEAILEDDLTFIVIQRNQ